MAANAEQIIEKAMTKDSMKALDKLTEVVDGQRRIRSDPPLIVPVEEVYPAARERADHEFFHNLLRRYRQSLPTDRRHLLEQYEFSQMARKVVGVGSVGTRVWIILLHGQRPDDVLFLQAKEAEASVLERFTKKSAYANHGARVVAGQRLMQAASDIFLGWQRVEASRRPTGGPRLLPAPAAGLEGVDRSRDRAYPKECRSTGACAPTPWPVPCPLGRPHRHGGVPRRQ